jgi:hypothetical protein
MKFGFIPEDFPCNTIQVGLFHYRRTVQKRRGRNRQGAPKPLELISVAVWSGDFS